MLRRESKNNLSQISLHYSYLKTHGKESNEVNTLAKNAFHGRRRITRKSSLGVKRLRNSNIIKKE